MGVVRVDLAPIVLIAQPGLCGQIPRNSRIKKHAYLESRPTVQRAPRGRWLAQKKPSPRRCLNASQSSTEGSALRHGEGAVSDTVIAAVETGKS